MNRLIHGVFVVFLYSLCFLPAGGFIALVGPNLMDSGLVGWITLSFVSLLLLLFCLTEMRQILAYQRHKVEGKTYYEDVH